MQWCSEHGLYSSTSVCASPGFALQGCDRLWKLSLAHFPIHSLDLIGLKGGINGMVHVGYLFSTEPGHCKRLTAVW